MYASNYNIGSQNFLSPAGAGKLIMLGQEVHAVDPIWGDGDFIYAKLPSGTMKPGRLVTLDANFQMADLANTANAGTPVYVVREVMDATNNAVYGWVMRSGMAPVQLAAGGAVGPVFVGGAGQGTTVAANGKQIMGMQVLTANTGTITKQGTTTMGGSQLKLGNAEGLYVGMAVSGSGIAGGTTITSIDETSGNFIGLSAPMTGQDTVTITFTNTGFGIARFNSPHVQGQVV